MLSRCVCSFIADKSLQSSEIAGEVSIGPAKSFQHALNVAAISRRASEVSTCKKFCECKIPCPYRHRVPCASGSRHYSAMVREPVNNNNNRKITGRDNNSNNKINSSSLPSLIHIYPHTYILCSRAQEGFCALRNEAEQLESAV